MNTNDLNDIIRMAQVLKMRTRHLSIELTKAKREPQAGAATKASELAEEAEKKLSRILADIMGD